MKALVLRNVVRALVIPAVLLVVAEGGMRLFMPQSDTLAAPSAVFSGWSASMANRP